MNNVTLPEQSAVEFQLLLHLFERHNQKSRPLSTKEACQLLAERFGLTNEQIDLVYESKRNQWVTVVGYAKQALKGNGLIKAIERDQWVITEQGIQKLGVLRGALTT
ncbi:winged helix-turn-helix domain-containing protein [Ammoniphilus resinae]|uniref:Restriction endonuclease Mrr n=1 Tax=Ammoniphilus resinae TaxID=861532 RepID=A0ABS4GSZ5_9BACL|nr:winged helix-turn-helix domain-containing protein [Ammoniphilus resinae]MBP1933366.1 restriction endonuclease Mrr [Ammoniphilus resinae]